MNFNNNIQIGDQFYKTPKKHILCEVTDIVKQFSTAKNEWVGIRYIAKGINCMATNEFEVCKVTIVRNRLSK